MPTRLDQIASKVERHRLEDIGIAESRLAATPLADITDDDTALNLLPDYEDRIRNSLYYSRALTLNPEAAFDLEPNLNERLFGKSTLSESPAVLFKDAFVQSMADKPAMMLKGVEVYTPGRAKGLDTLLDKSSTFLQSLQDPKRKQELQEVAGGKLWPTGEGRRWWQVELRWLPEVINAWAVNVADQIPIMLITLSGRKAGKAIGKPLGAIAGVTAALVTGGPDPSDVITAPAVVAITSEVTKHLGGAAPMVAMEAGNFMDEAEALGIDRDISEKYAKPYGLGSGTIEYAQQLWMLGRYKQIIKIARRTILKQVLSHIGGSLFEGIEEMSQQGLQNFLMQKAVADMKKRHPDYQGEAPTITEGMKRSGQIGAGVAFLTGMPGTGMSIAEGALARRQLVKPETKKFLGEPSVAEQARKLEESIQEGVKAAPSKPIRIAEAPAKPVTPAEPTKPPPMAQAGGTAAETVSPNLYIGNVTAGMKRRIAKGSELDPADIQGFKEGGFPTKRTKLEMTRQEAGNYLTWAISAIDNIIGQVEKEGAVPLTMNQLAMTQALIGDIKALQEALGFEVKPAQITFKQAKKHKGAIVGPTETVSEERYNAIVDKINNEETLTEEEHADYVLALAQERAAAKSVMGLTTKQAIEAAVRPDKLETVEMTTLELFNKVMKGKSEAAKRAYVAAGRDMVKQHKNLAKFAREKLEQALATKGEINRVMNAIARARTETEQIKAMAAVAAVTEKAQKRGLAKRITQPVPESVDFFYRQAIELLREGIDPKFRSQKTVQTREKTRAFLDRNPQMAEEMPTKLIKKLNQKPISDFTVEELAEIADAIDLLVKRGKLKRKLSLAQKARKRTEKLTEMVTNITKGKPLEADTQPKVFSTTKEGLVKPKIQAARAWTLRPSRLFDMLDGRKSFSGPVHNFFVDTTNRLVDAKWRAIDTRTDAGKAKQKELGITPHTLTKVREVNGTRYTVDEMIDIYAKSKNKLAKLAILYGNNLTEPDIDAVIANLTEQEKVWGDYIIEDYARNYSRLRGTVIEIENRDMGSEENYTPIRRTEIDYSTHTEEIVDAILRKENLRKAYAERGFTIRRKNIPSEFQRPVQLGVTKMWFEQVAKQEEYMHLAAHIKDMHRVRENREFSQAVQKHFGKEFNKVIKDYVNRVANPNVYRTFNSIERMSRLLRQNAAVAYLAYNMVTMAKQLPSVMLYIADAGPTYLLASAAKFTANPMKMIQEVRELDPQVKHKSIERELEELKQARGTVVTQLIARVGDVGMQGIHLIDTVARTIGWDAVYSKAKALGKSEDEAIRLAQNATLRTQPAAAAKDLPALYATSEFINWFTMFTNQLNQIYNIATYDIPSYIKNKEYGAAALSTMGLATTALAIWAISHKKLPEDEEELLDAGTEQFINAIPLFGKTVMASKRGWGSSDIPAFESGKAVGRSIAAIERGEFTDYDKRVIMEAIAVSTGLPFIGIKRGISTIQEEDPSLLLGGSPQKKKTLRRTVKRR